MNISTQVYAKVFGVAFIAAGVLGFVPWVTWNGYLLGLFMVDPVHNVVHLLSGAIALFVAAKMEYAKLYFKVFGVIYALVAIWGFACNGDLWLMHVNMADNYLHMVIAVVALYVGFSRKVK